TQDTPFSALVEEEQLGHIDAPAFPASFTGNEDTTDLDGADDDTQAPPDPVTNFNITTHVDFADFLVSGGNGDPQFVFNQGIENSKVQFANAGGFVLSQGDDVRYDRID